MSRWGWIIEYLRLMAAYGFVLYIWPSVVFEGHLKGKPLRYRFGFCITVPLLLINAFVLTMGLLHALRPWVAAVVFYCVFLWRLIRNHRPLKGLVDDLRHVGRETMTLRRALLRQRERLREGLRAWLHPARAALRGRGLEFGLLLLLLVFGTVYFSYAAFDSHAFGCGDQYVHHQWMQGLAEGRAFESGIYPEAMHCMIFLTCSVFGMELYSGVLFFAGLQIHVTLLCAWLLLRQLLRWRYSPLAALAMFLCLDQLCPEAIFGMSRLSWTLPMEYALGHAFLAAACLLRFLRRVLRGHKVRLRPLKIKEWGVLRDEDLFLFAAAVSATLAVHFFSTALAFFFCAAVALVRLRQVLHRGSFLPLAAAVLLALAVAVLPMGAAFAAGYPLQGSLYWALGYIGSEDEETHAADSALGDYTELTAPEQTQTAEEAPQLPAAQTPETQAEEAQPAPSAARRALGLALSKAQALYRFGYQAIYPGVRGTLVLCATVFALLLSVIAHLALARRDRLRRLRAVHSEEPVPERDAFDGYGITVLCSLMLVTAYGAQRLGLPRLLEQERLYSCQQLCAVTLYAVPLDCLMLLLARTRREGLCKALSAAALLAVYLLAQLGGVYHGYLFNYTTRYAAAVDTTRRLIDTLPRQTYTVISTSEELYQVVGHGYHEELLTLLRRQSDEGYTIPTPWLLLYVEKHPLRYVQLHFLTGPRWLAREVYTEIYPGFVSEGPEILRGEISPEDAAKPIKYGKKLSDTATDFEGRIILESKAWEWYEAFSALHPRACQVLYEDEDFVCFCIRQNPASLYSLGVMPPAEGGA